MAGQVVLLRAVNRIPNTTQQNQDEIALDANRPGERHPPAFRATECCGAGAGRPQAVRTGTLPEPTPVLSGGGGHGAEGVRYFLIYDCRTPSHPINLGSVFTKTVSYDFSNKYTFQSDGVLFRLKASRLPEADISRCGKYTQEGTEPGRSSDNIKTRVNTLSFTFGREREWGGGTEKGGAGGSTSMFNSLPILWSQPGGRTRKI